MTPDQSTDAPVLFKVRNHHSPNCGTSPQIDGDRPKRYYGYYANEHGEQAIFEYNFETHTARIWMGDAGWEESHTVVNGVAPDLILNPGVPVQGGADTQP